MTRLLAILRGSPILQLVAAGAALAFVAFNMFNELYFDTCANGCPEGIAIVISFYSVVGIGLIGVIIAILVRLFSSPDAEGED